MHSMVQKIESYIFWIRVRAHIWLMWWYVIIQSSHANEHQSFFLLLEIFCSEKRLRDNWMTCNFQAFKSNMWSFSARLVPRPKKLCTVWNLRNLFLNFPNLHTQVKNPAIVKGGWSKFFTEVVNFQIGRLVLMACDKLKYWFFCVCWCSHLTWKMLDGQKSPDQSRKCVWFLEPSKHLGVAALFLVFTSKTGMKCICFGRRGTFKMHELEHRSATKTDTWICAWMFCYGLMLCLATTSFNGN